MKSVSRLMLTLAASTLLIVQASAHFVYLLPVGGEAAVLAVFTDYLKPDENVDIKKIQSTRLVHVDASGKSAAVEWSYLKHALKGSVASDPSVVWGVTDYGTSSGRHSGGVPNRLFYYSKAVLGDFSELSAEVLAAGETLTIEPVRAGERFQFRVLHQGQPVVGSECHVLGPGAEKSLSVTTDERGMAAVEITDTGLYGIRVKVSEEADGNLEGVRYQRINHWSTLVLQLTTSP